MDTIFNYWTNFVLEGIDFGNLNLIFQQYIPDRFHGIVIRRIMVT